MLVKEWNIRWKIINSLAFETKTQEMHNWMLRPVEKGIEFDHDMKKEIHRTFKDKKFTDGLTKRWKYNGKMGDCMWAKKFDKEYIIQTLELLSKHHPIEIMRRDDDYQNLNWKIAVPQINEKAKQISLHNFSIFKDQILLNQHNPLYNTKIGEKQKPTPRQLRMIKPYKN
jgi:hypothetical protein